MTSSVIVSVSSSETLRFGEDMGAALLPGMIVGLTGSLGAGKTVMIQGMCKGLGYDGNVTSPTFSLLNIYAGRVEIYHFDFYRLEGIADLEDIGYEEYFGSDKGVCLIEWADRVPDAMPPDAVIVNLEILSETERRITVDSPTTILHRSTGE